MYETNEKITVLYCRLRHEDSYGYIKDPDHSGNIIPDRETKDVVIRIFREFLSTAERRMAGI